MNAFNLINEKWIPVIDKNGNLINVGFLELLTETKNYRDIYHYSPLVKLGMFRVLLALIRRIEPVNSKKSWSELYKRGSFNKEAIENYFKKWHDRFYLFHELYPFYQVFEHPTAEPAPVTKIVMHKAAGNNVVYYDHSNVKTTPLLTPADAALHLIAFQTFAPGGGVSKSLVKGITTNFTGSPFTGILINLVKGNDLFSTLMLNNLISPELNVVQNEDENDTPCWENNQGLLRTEKPLTGYLDYLTFTTRAVKLIPDIVKGNFFVNQVQISQGRSLPEMVREPFTAYLLSKKDGFISLKIRPEQAAWREFNNLVALTGKVNLIPPQNIYQANLLLDENYIDTETNFRLESGGLATEKAKLILWRLDELPLPVYLLKDQDFINTVEKALKEADSTGYALKKFTERIVGELTKFQGNTADKDTVQTLYKNISTAENYWSELEIPFKKFVAECAKGNPFFDSAFENWEAFCKINFLKCKRIVEKSVIGSPRGPKAIAKSN
ncbi:MAG: type I-E CRISPR-associated protein Cse1/CasA [Ignavibacteriaceae bacterium]|nr:type I-E CRISPR-associated protein Cse1/CasA [Ignavibacteriaceae bacterium]